MAQETPSNILYAQAIDVIRKLTVAYSTNKNKTPQEISQIINDTLSKFEQNAGRALTQYIPVKRSEIPLSFKQNTFNQAIQSDINILQDQVDLLNASAVFLYNFSRTDILQAKYENQRIQNKIKTLELYSSSSDNSQLFFGDTFITEDFIDWNFVSITERATLLTKGYVALHLDSEVSAYSSGSEVKVLDTSNGFFGNNQEIRDPATATVDPVSGQKLYTFIGETYKASNVYAALDDKPTTWFEFEKYLVDPSDRATAKNYNFDYTLSANNALTAHLKTTNSVNQQQTSGIIDWADGIEDGVLKFNCDIDLGVDRSINHINLLPYGLQDNINNPIHVVKVSTSLNGTDWDIIGPENVWISNSIDRKISSINAENILINDASWITDGSVVRYIHFEIEQPKPIDCNIGHQYYVSKDSIAATTPNYNIEIPSTNGNVAYDANIPYDSPIIYGGIATTGNTANSGYGDYAVASGETVLPAQNTNALIDQYRKQGPIPPAENPLFYANKKNATVNDLIQKVEVLKGKRWAIGIRDIAVHSNVYASKGTLVSKRFNVSGIVDRVALEADVFIPEGYDQSINWIKFYVSADDGASWFQISRIQDDFLDIPEIVAFNDPTPKELREAGVGYYDVKGTVDALRFKTEITRPSDAQNSTPILKSYKLKVIKRS